MTKRPTILVASLIVALIASFLLASNAKSSAEREIQKLTMRHVEGATSVPEAPQTARKLVEVAEAAEPEKEPQKPPQAKKARVADARETGTAQGELMRRIAWCESRSRQFDENGNVLRGKVDPRDSGKYQVNTGYHLADSQKLGMDIFTEAGNEAYAWHLLKTQGTRPWSASKYCWSSEIVLKQRKYPGLL